jgi:hypothetical protein
MLGQQKTIAALRAVMGREKRLARLLPVFFPTSLVRSSDRLIATWIRAQWIVCLESGRKMENAASYATVEARFT